IEEKDRTDHAGRLAFDQADNLLQELRQSCPGRDTFENREMSRVERLLHWKSLALGKEKWVSGMSPRCHAGDCSRLGSFKELEGVAEIASEILATKHF